ncbi:MAG: hypothetical protein BGN92_09790 [Sphingobacteriales bacterium 41-5]|nr:MAG: hypothetical protein BGN92_09790 [Sphingobacteriales bacterium 41-5]
MTKGEYIDIIYDAMINYGFIIGLPKSKIQAKQLYWIGTHDTMPCLTYEGNGLAAFGAEILELLKY